MAERTVGTEVHGLPPDSLAPDQVARLWERYLHEDNIGLQRGNFFLVAESMLLVAYSGILPLDQSDAGQNSAIAVRVIAGFGFLLTLIWAYVNSRHRRYRKFLRQSASRFWPEFAITLPPPRRHPVSTAVLMSYVVPALAAVVWLTLLALA